MLRVQVAFSKCIKKLRLLPSTTTWLSLHTAWRSQSSVHKSCEFSGARTSSIAEIHCWAFCRYLHLVRSCAVFHCTDTLEGVRSDLAEPGTRCLDWSLHHSLRNLLAEQIGSAVWMWNLLTMLHHQQWQHKWQEYQSHSLVHQPDEKVNTLLWMASKWDQPYTRAGCRVWKRKSHARRKLIVDYYFYLII